jgi:hypothetical protein
MLNNTFTVKVKNILQFNIHYRKLIVRAFALANV